MGEEIQSGADGKITVSFHGRVALLTMKCGENRANASFVEKMNKALDLVLQKHVNILPLYRNEGIQVLVTRGMDKFYHNGLDLKWLSGLASGEGGKKRLQSELLNIRNISMRFLTFPLPTLAAINGHCYAYGAILSLCHDFRMMQTDRGWWCLNEVHTGVPMASQTVVLVKSKLPVPTFHDAVVMGKRYTAEEAKGAGIIHKTCSSNKLLQEALAFAEHILPTGGFQRDSLDSMKNTVYAYVRDIPPDDDLISKI